jgi:hypothetical protein
MTDQNITTALRASPTRGLATVALLKTNFDAGRDHIAMFEPFIDDAVMHCDESDFSAEDIRSHVLLRHALSLPIPLVRTLLSRAAHHGLVRKEGGHYFRETLARSRTDLRADRAAVEDRQRRLAKAFREDASARGVTIASDEDALGLILEFLERYHVSLVIEGGLPQPRVSSQIEEGDTDRRLRAAAAFLGETIVSGTELAAILQETLEGFILQNTLLLTDISTAARRFHNLHVYCDSGLLFAALGLRGRAMEVVTRELFQLLRDTGATLNVFKTTIREMRRILDLYEDRIATADGRMSLWPNELTRYFLTQQYTPSDVRQQSSLIEYNLGAFAINIRELPSHNAGTTLDESDLAKRLTDSRTGEGGQRVDHDVECIAGVLTLRAGRSSDALADVGPIFVSTSGIVRPAEQWFRAQGGTGVPPMIHYLVLSNLAWLKRPSAAPTLKLHELVALCVAALRPTREAWQVFVRHLKKLESSGDLSSDEATAIVVSTLTDKILSETELDEESDAETLTEIVERLKATYRAGAEAEISRAQEIARESERRAERIAARAGLTEAESLRLRQHLEHRGRMVGRVVSWVVAAILFLAFVTGTVVSVITAFGEGRFDAPFLLIALTPLAVAGLLSLLNGFHVARLRVWIEEGVTARTTAWMMGGARSQPPGAGQFQA